MIPWIMLVILSFASPLRVSENYQTLYQLREFWENSGTGEVPGPILPVSEKAASQAKRVKQSLGWMGSAFGLARNAGLVLQILEKD